MIVVVGLSHRTAPIAIRERVALDSERATLLCRELVETGAAAEAFVVSTCNRVEIVASPRDRERGDETVRACRRALGGKDDEIDRHLYAHVGVEGVRHLVRVASSLDSLVVGEPQILGQLKQGFELARRAGTVGPKLHRAFARAVRGARRIRTQTAIGSGQVSVPSIAIELSTQIFGDLRGRRAALIGAGDMGQSVARLLSDAGAKLWVVGRSLDKVDDVARAVGGEPRLMDHLDQLLEEVDVVVSSTSAPHAVVQRSQVERAHKARRGRNLFLIDLAVPRDIEAEVGELDGVFLYNVDDLSSVVEESTSIRRREAERATELVEGVVQEWVRWSESQEATPLIKALRAQLTDAFEQEMQRSLRGRLRDLDDEQRGALSKMVEAGVNRVLHVPSTKLREQAVGDGGDLEELREVLFGLFGLDSEGVARAVPPGADRGADEEPPTSADEAMLGDGEGEPLGDAGGDDLSEAAARSRGVG